jgi:predicted neuraminidase
MSPRRCSESAGRSGSLEFVSGACSGKAPLLVVLIAFLSHPAAAGNGIEVRKVFGPEAPGPYKHPASITQLEDGDFYIAYYGGEGEYAKDTAVYGSRLESGAEAWEAPRVISDTPFHSEGNAVVWQAPDGLVWLFHVVRYGATWSTSRIVARFSRDGARTWSDTFFLSFEEGLMVRNRPIVLAGGDYLLPAYHETGADTERVGPDSTSLFFRYDRKANRWSETARIRSRTGNIQPAPVELPDGRLVAYCRRGGGYEPCKDGYIVRSESRDGGKTWSPGVDSIFQNPNSAIDVLTLRNGHILLVFNDSMNERTPLVAALSTDGDASYPHRRAIAEGPGDFAYPYAIQAKDGKIHVIFTTDERTVIRLAVFEEAQLLESAGRAKK